MIERGNITSTRGVNHQLFASQTVVCNDSKTGHAIVAFDDNTHHVFKSIITASLATGVTKQSISLVLNKQRKSTYGYYWSKVSCAE